MDSEEADHATNKGGPPKKTVISGVIYNNTDKWPKIDGFHWGYNPYTY